jgi:hypothetical protein
MLNSLQCLECGIRGIRSIQCKPAQAQRQESSPPLIQNLIVSLHQLRQGHACNLPVSTATNPGVSMRSSATAERRRVSRSSQCEPTYGTPSPMIATVLSGTGRFSTCSTSGARTVYRRAVINDTIHSAGICILIDTAETNVRVPEESESKTGCNT